MVIASFPDLINQLIAYLCHFGQNLFNVQICTTEKSGIATPRQKTLSNVNSGAQ